MKRNQLPTRVVSLYVSTVEKNYIWYAHWRLLLFRFDRWH